MACHVRSYTVRRKNPILRLHITQFVTSPNVALCTVKFPHVIESPDKKPLHIPLPYGRVNAFPFGEYVDDFVWSYREWFAQDGYLVLSHVELGTHKLLEPVSKMVKNS